jgi:hypothetical protein
MSRKIYVDGIEMKKCRAGTGGTKTIIEQGGIIRVENLKIISLVGLKKFAFGIKPLLRTSGFMMNHLHLRY